MTKREKLAVISALQFFLLEEGGIDDTLSQPEIDSLVQGIIEEFNITDDNQDETYAEFIREIVVKVKQLTAEVLEG